MQLKNVDTWFEEYPVEVEWLGARWVPGDLDEEHALITTIQENIEEIEERRPIIEASQWGTDGGLITQNAEIPTI
ncbi:peptidase, partial [Bacillus pseudomycoides]|nr:peptidase [Bacillus pseudomycoides]